MGLKTHSFHVYRDTAYIVIRKKYKYGGLKMAEREKKKKAQSKQAKKRTVNLNPQKIKRIIKLKKA